MKLKKIIVAGLLGVTLISSMGITAMAVPEYHKAKNTQYLSGKDYWNRGAKNNSNGYYMAYSYYKNQSGTYRSYSRIRNSDSFTRSNLGSNNTTVCANSKSVPYHDGVKNSAANTDQYGNIIRATSEIDGGAEYRSSDVY